MLNNVRSDAAADQRLTAPGAVRCAPLFRREAIEYQRHRRDWGGVASLQPLSGKITVWFLVGFLALVVGFLFIAEYARKETSIGYLTPTTGTAKIYLARPGTIRQVHVREGNTVVEGQPLLTVETAQIAADGSDVNAALLDTLRTHRRLLASNIDAEEKRTESERQRLSSLIQGLESELSHLQARLKLQAEQLKLTESEVEAAKQLLAKGHLPRVELRRRTAQALEHQQALNASKQEIAAKQNQLTEARFSLKQLPTLMAQKVQVLRNESAATEQRIAEITARSAYVVRAPIAGRVSTLQATAGQTTDPQRLQLEIIPVNAVLHAELFLPARAVGFVEVGQPVRIMYDAFPYQQFGTYTGRVVNVSQTILTGADVGGPVKLTEPAYRVTASLDRPHLEIHGKTVALQPDMLLRADIILERRSLIGWLLNPLRSVRM